MTEHINSHEDLHEEEIWKPIPGWEGLYEASNMGRVRSLDHVDRRGRHLSGRVLKQVISNGRRYLCVTLHKNNQQSTQNVHVLICQAFHGPRTKGKVVGHWDGNGLNNIVSNLRWTTQIKNIHDKYRHNTIIRGEKQWNSKLSENDVIAIREMYKNATMSCFDIAEKYNLHHTTVHRIINKTSWRHV
jgi:hypothetical protein